MNKPMNCTYSETILRLAKKRVLSIFLKLTG